VITYDFICAEGHEQIDVRAHYGDRPACPTCGGATEILWKSSFPNVIGDDIPGGMTVEHMTPEPETFYSKSEHRRRVRELGLRIRDHHNPPPGSDKSRHTTRWV
jgi:hypothetical protein